ncbi:MAG: alpha/beta hydrolase [Saccharospirillum sp.]|nr:alpha/beta hydrolase [Saccharospirillum sp.]
MTLPIHFAHANGFPSASYQTMLTHLADHHDVHQIPLLGHDPAYPVTNNWPHLKQQLIDSIERQCNRPVIGLGHSLGGALTLMASLERPDLFAGVIMLDVPVFSRFESWMVRMIKSLGLIDNVTPAARSKHRRTHWPSQAAAVEHFSTRGLFKQFHPQCLQDYIASATRPAQGGGVELAYELSVELAIFRTVPHTISLSPGQAALPYGVLVGRDTDTVLKRQYLRMKHQLGFHAMRVPGSHLFPLEYPLETARTVSEMIHQLHRLKVA